MLQILGWAEIEVSIISGLYKIVARVYDILLQIVQDSRDITGSNFNDLIVTCYVLAGVFMLFRIALSLVQMLINPEQVNDKQAGAGKMITRVVISVILLLLLRPDGFLFAPYDKDSGAGGLLPRIEYSLVNSKDGLVINLVNSRINLESAQTSKKESSTKTSSTVLIDDVYADSMKKPLTCYFVQKAIRKTDTVYTGRAGSTTVKSKKYIKGAKKYGIIKLTFSSDGDGQALKGGNAYDAYIKRYAGEFEDTSDNKRVYFINYYGSRSFRVPKAALSGPFVTYYPTKCSQLVITPPASEDKKGKVSIGVISKASDYNKNKYLHSTSGGYATLDKAYERMINEGAEDLREGVSDGDVQAAMPTVEDFEGAKEKSEYSSFLEKHLKFPDYSVAFAQGTASSFQECATGKDCDEAQSEMFKSTEGDDKLAKLVDKGELDLGLIPSLIAGIGLIVYLLILCVDVIVRRFKLMILQVMAPIPAISYISPKDKIFGQWSKMYISTYLDLFIKLIAIALAVGLLGSIIGPNADSSLFAEGGLLLKFFYIVAILVFAKLVPSMISKIFGLDSMGGSFKDILGMGKAALGFGAGAVAGAAVGAISGQGWKQSLSGLAKGTIMGAGAGAKGNVFGGASKISASNLRDAQGRAMGLNWFERKAAALADAAGYDPLQHQDNLIAKQVGRKEMLDNFRKHKDNIENMADSSNYLSNLDIMRKNEKIGKKEYKAARDNFIKLNENNKVDGQTGHIFYKGANGQWIDSGQSDKYVEYDSKNNTATISNIDFEGAAQGKILHAEEMMRSEIDNNNALRTELGMKTGQTINDFDEFKAMEGKARDISNTLDTEIQAKKSSDTYRKRDSFKKFGGMK